MTTKGHHKKSLSTPVPASESEFIEPSSVPKTDLYVSFGSTGKISVRLDSNVEFVNWRINIKYNTCKLTNQSKNNNRERTVGPHQCQKYYDLEVVERLQDLQRQMRRILFWKLRFGSRISRPIFVPRYVVFRCCDHHHQITHTHTHTVLNNKIFGIQSTTSLS